MSIFATIITDSTDHSNARIRAIVRTNAHAESILSAAVAVIVSATGELPEVVEDDIRGQAQGSQASASAAVRLVSSALQAVESAYTSTHPMAGAGEGLGSAAPVLDCRKGQTIAESILIA